MTKLSLAIIPIFVLVAVLGVAVYLKLMSPSPATQALPQVNTAETAPDSGYGVINPDQPGTGSAADLNSELQTTVDDGGATELNDLDQMVGSL